MSSTASETIGPVDGLWRELLSALIRQFPPPDEIGEERGVALDGDPMYVARIHKAFKPECNEGPRHRGGVNGDIRNHTWYQGVLWLATGSFPTTIDRALAIKLVNNQAELKRIIREEILLIDACSLENDLGVIAVPEGYGHETYLRTFLRDHQGDFMFISPEFGRKGVPARVEPGKMIRVKLYRQPKGSRVGREGIARFLQRQKGNLFLGAHGLALICACTNWSGPNNAWTCSLDEVDGYSGDDALGVPAFGRFFPGGGWRLDVRSLDPTADPHASAHYIFGFSDAAVEEHGN